MNMFGVVSFILIGISTIITLVTSLQMIPSSFQIRVLNPQQPSIGQLIRISQDYPQFNKNHHNPKRSYSLSINMLEHSIGVDLNFIELFTHNFESILSNIQSTITHTIESLTTSFIHPSLTTTTLVEPISSPISIPIDEDPKGGTLLVLGNDLLIFLCATISIVPLFQYLKASPVIGFLAAGLLMGPAGLGIFEDLKDLESLAEAGIVFLLFEQGLELTVDRLKGLSKYAFGMGTLQVLLCTLSFFIFPFIGGVQFLEIIMRSTPEIVDIKRYDEALVIGAALSLSSSAFVLKLLQEKNQLSSKFGAAALGVLLFQDIAVVPLLVLLPIMESNSNASEAEVLVLLGATIVKAFLGLGGILVVGGAIVRFLFSLVAQTRSSETFVALVVLVALGSGALTQSLGLSSTLGAFTAGTLLAESNYRTQIESDIKPFRGLLLGLFFLTTGATVDPFVIKEQWTTVLALLAGLIAFKAFITTLIGPLFGLSKSESVRTGLLLSGGGEFAFVVLTLADKLQVIPGALAKILVGVVVLSMAITPYLSNLGDAAAAFIEDMERNDLIKSEENTEALMNTNGHHDYSTVDVVVICGFGQIGETISKVLLNPSVVDKFPFPNGLNSRSITYMAFDLDPNIVMKGYREGKQVLYGDGTQPAVLNTAGIITPRAFVVTYSDREENFKATERLRQNYPSVPIYVRAPDMQSYLNLREAGATEVIPEEKETSLRILYNLLNELGVTSDDVSGILASSRMDLDVMDDESFAVFEAEKHGVVPVVTNRVNAFDAVSSPLKSLKNNFGNVNGNVGSFLKDARKQVTGMIGGLDIFTVSKGIEEGDKGEEGEDDDEESFPGLRKGVDICLLPEKRTTNSSK